ncbi:MAG: tRNA dihydrouridine synthase DusB [Solobacterium sp.]|nr:tRNA dihydrouridine synthase DusB [Solobacterium sp.]
MEERKVVKIGNIQLDNPIVAAPLAGISNPVYREMCRNFGAGLVVSEMISDKALHYQNKKTQDMCATSGKEHPVALQLFGSDTETMAEASEYLSKNTDCDIIDINMGCPVNKVLKAHSGSYLLQDVEEAYQIMKAVKEHTDRPVTVKIRAGWDKEHINCVEIAQAAEKAGLSAIAIHARTRAQMYSGEANYEYIRMVKDAVNIPVIGNGDIKTVDDAKRMLAETKCDAIMVGRGILGKPYFLQELKAYFCGGEYEAPSCIDRLDMVLDYTHKLCAYESEKKGIRMMRGMLAWYIAGMPHAAKYKNAFSMVNTEQEVIELVEEYKKRLENSR